MGAEPAGGTGVAVGKGVEVGTGVDVGNGVAVAAGGAVGNVRGCWTGVELVGSDVSTMMTGGSRSRKRGPVGVLQAPIGDAAG